MRTSADPLEDVERQPAESHVYTLTCLLWKQGRKPIIPNSADILTAQVGINNLQHMAWGVKLSELYNWEFLGWNEVAVEGSSEKNLFYHMLHKDKMDNKTKKWKKINVTIEK